MHVLDSSQPPLTRPAAPCAQVWLQQLAWTEAQKPGRLAERAERARGPLAAAELGREPMFCMETALKALYWATLVYRYDEAAPDLTRDAAPAPVRRAWPSTNALDWLCMQGLQSPLSQAALEMRQVCVGVNMVVARSNGHKCEQHTSP